MNQVSKNISDWSEDDPFDFLETVGRATTIAELNSALLKFMVAEALRDEIPEHKRVKLIHWFSCVGSEIAQLVENGVDESRIQDLFSKGILEVAYRDSTVGIENFLETLAKSSD